MNRKSLWIGLAAYSLWGILPLYWRLLETVDPIVILCNRVLWSAVFGVLVLAAQKRLPEVLPALRDGRLMKSLVPAAIVVTANWGVYIWAVNCGHVLDASLGYYLNPLMSFALGLLVFRERCGALEYAAIGVAALGVAVSALSYGAVPYIALAVGGLFAAYGAIKKKIHIDAILGITAETLIVAPFALAYLLVSPAGQAAFSAMTLKTALLLLASGPVTAVPLMLFAQGVNDLPLSTMGLLQFVCPTLIALTGACFLGESFTGDKIVAFAFILAGLVLYTVGLARRERRIDVPGTDSRL